ARGAGAPGRPRLRELDGAGRGDGGGVQREVVVQRRVQAGDGDDTLAVPRPAPARRLTRTGSRARRRACGQCPGPPLLRRGGAAPRDGEAERRRGVVEPVRPRRFDLTTPWSLPPARKGRVSGPGRRGWTRGRVRTGGRGRARGSGDGRLGGVPHTSPFPPLSNATLLSSLRHLAAVVLLSCGLAASISAQAPTQTVRGVVFDRDARAPLPGAHVVVLETDPLIGTTTDADGRFVLAGVPVGRRALRVSFVGYEPVVLAEVLVGTGKEVVLEVGLREWVVEGAGGVVRPAAQSGAPLNDRAAVSARSFSVEEARRDAGAVDDPARLASAFAGVSTAGGVQENALVIRGNAPKGVLWRLEGVEIPNPNHFAGLTVAGGGGLTL